MLVVRLEDASEKVLDLDINGPGGSFSTAATNQEPARLLGVAPRVASAEWYEERSFPYGPGGYWTVRGVYCTPNFQTDIDKAPFLNDGGGSFALDERGAPRVIDIPEDSKYHDPTCGGLLRARFVLTIPTSPMPPGGYPLIVSSHGTGGDAYTFLGPNDFAGWAAREGIAVTGQEGVECCYARLDQFWATDPSGVRWELFLSHEDVVASPAPSGTATACCAGGCGA